MVASSTSEANAPLAIWSRPEYRGNMWLEKSVAVIIPAYCEERFIVETVRGVPQFVDRIYVVDDCSGDATVARLTVVAQDRLTCLSHPQNRGVGASIVTGYVRALADGIDVLAVMAGDGQMDARDLSRLITPVCMGEAEYVKGNRFRHAARLHMPCHRRLGGQALSALTRLATGLSVSDTQCGYTALAAKAARGLPLSELWPRFGYPNDLLGMLAAQKMRVAEVPVRPIYRGEKSGIRPWHALSIAGLVARRWLRERRRPEASLG